MAICNCRECRARRKRLHDMVLRRAAEQERQAQRQMMREAFASAGQHEPDCPCLVCHAKAGELTAKGDI